MEVLMRDLYCYECSLQFDTKHVFDVHLSVVHDKKLEIKQEYDSQPLVVPEPKELEIIQPDEENCNENALKRRKVSIKKTKSVHEKKQFKCDICTVEFGAKGNLNRHFGTVHEGKKQFKCDICNAKFTSKKG